jgi:hypothetical protein
MTGRLPTKSARSTPGLIAAETIESGLPYAPEDIQ